MSAFVLDYRPEPRTMSPRTKNLIRAAVVLLLLAAAYLVGYDGGYHMGRADEKVDQARMGVHP